MWHDSNQTLVRLKKGIALLSTMTMLLASIGGMTQPVAAAADYELQLNLNFDNSTIADSSGKNLAGTLTGTPSYVDGVSGKAMYFKGNSFIDMGKPAELQFGTSTNFSIAFWIDNKDTSNTNIVSNKNWSSGANTGFAITPWWNTVNTDKVNFTAAGKTRLDLFAAPTFANKGWTFMAYTYDRNGMLTVYQNNVKIGELNISSHKNATIDSLNFVIGADGNKNLTFSLKDAKLDEFRVYKGLIDQAEMDKLYMDGVPKLTITKVETAISDARASDLVYPESAYDKLGQDLAAFKSGIDAAASTSEKVAMVAALERSLAAFQAAGLSNVVYLDFDDETATDRSGKGNNGVLNGAPTFTEGVLGKAMYFKGNSYIDMGKPAALQFGANMNFSIAYWIDNKDTTNTAVVSNKNWSTGANTGFTISTWWEQANKDKVNFTAAGKTRIDTWATTVAGKGWTFMVYTYDRNGMLTVYQNNVKVSEVDISGVKGASIDSLNFVIGTDGAKNVSFNLKDAKLDEFRVYRGIINQNERESLQRDVFAKQLAEKVEKSIDDANASGIIFPQTAYDQIGQALARYKTNLDTTSAESTKTLMDELSASLQAFEDSPGVISGPDLLHMDFTQSVGSDSSPGQHVGSAVGAPVMYDHPLFAKPVLALDGIDSYVRIPNETKLSPKQMSMAASFSLDTLSRTQTIIGKTHESDYSMAFNPISKKLEAMFYVKEDAGTEGYVTVDSGKPLEANKIYYALATYDGATAKLYINGEETMSRSRVGEIGGATKVDLAIGASANPVGAQDYMQGKIGLVQLYSQAVNAFKAKFLYKQYVRDYASTVTSIRLDVPTNWVVGQSGQAVLQLIDNSANEVKAKQQAIVYQSQHPEVATVNAQGIIVPIAPGKSLITAQLGTFSASVEITVRAKVRQYLQIDGPQTMQPGDVANLQAKFINNDGSMDSVTLATYSSDNPNVIQVDASGKVRAIAPGTALIHVEANGLTADLMIVVAFTPPVGEPGKSHIISLQFAGPHTLKVGDTASTVIQAVYDDNSLFPVNQYVSYRSDNPSVVQIDAVTGELTALTSGVARLYATYQGFAANYAIAVVPNQGPLLQGVNLTAPASMKVGEQVSLQAQAIYDHADPIEIASMAEWTVEDSSILSIDSQGRLTGLKQGTTVVTVVYQDKAAQSSIRVLDVDNGSGGGGGDSSYEGNSSGSSNPTDHKPGSTLVTDEQLQGLSGNIRVDIASDITQVLFPALASKLSGSQVVSIGQDDLSLHVSGKLLQSAAKEMVLKTAGEGKLAVSFPAMSEQDQQKWENTLKQDAGAMSLVSRIYDFSAELQMANGQKIATELPQGSVQIEFVVPQGADKELLGVYQLFQDGSTKYVGGHLTDRGIESNLDNNGKYAVLSYKKTYSDVPVEHWAFRTIQVMSANHTVKGVSDQYFQPERSITRAEFVALLVNSLELKPSKAEKFTDVPSSAWYAAYIDSAAGAGLIDGKGDSLFKPDAEISREEMAVLLVRAYERKYGKVELKQASIFLDMDQTSTWARDSVQMAAQLGLLNGRGNGAFVPEEPSKRAEAVQVMMKLQAK
ncbi:LamG-like jellyroll fold domain-containing protein [Paenibacillus sp. 2RAB27]|uniref:LamG-like jellyroll fold domain-containing protein n=1 Tax=Paenibacillus sp. 2RAB27 TaxID=3232991 RepID=UPI003F97A08C